MQNDQNAVRERHLKSLAAAVSNEFSNLSVSGGASYAVFTGATSITSGTGGLVPAPQAGEENYFLSGNGTWAPPTDTTYSIASTTEAGLMSAADKIKLDGIDGDAEENAIEEIWIDDVRQTIINKKVPLNLSDYAKKTDVASVWKRKGSVNSFSDLPTNAEEGDVYNIRTAGGVDDFGVSIKSGDNVARTFDGKWDVLAGTVDLSGYVEKVSGKQLSTEDFTTAQKRKLDNLASITSAGANITISGGTISAAGSNYTLPTATATQKGGVKIGGGLSMSGDTLSRSDTFTNKVTLSGGLVSRSTASDLSFSSIDAVRASINECNSDILVNGSKIDACSASIDAGSASINAAGVSISGAPSFTGGFYVSPRTTSFLDDSTILACNSDILVNNSTIDAAGSKINAPGALINADNIKIETSHPTINATGASINAYGVQINALPWIIINGGTKFTEKPTLSSGIYAPSTESHLGGSTIRAHAALIDAGGVGATASASISGNPIFSGNPMFTGNVTFTEPIYIDNTGSTVKGALCFDIDSGKPRLKMRIPGAGSSYTDFIFNCDTSITGGTG